MTRADSVHSTPSLNTSSSNIIDLSAARAAARPAVHRAVAVLPAEDAAEFEEAPRKVRRPQEPQTETAKNAKLREKRRDAWWLAGRVTDYWRARLDWEHALETAQAIRDRRQRLISTD